MKFIDNFNRNASIYADKSAVNFEDTKLTYNNLEQQANKFANMLSSMGIQEGDPICTFLSGSPELIITLLAVFKIGAIYVPIDPNFPPERVKYIIDNTGCKLFVCREKPSVQILDELILIFSHKNINKYNSDHKHSEYSEENLAYILYTSGSTGKPKGVEITRRSLNNFLYSLIKRLGFNHSLKILSLTSPSFDISLLEFLLPLSVGGEIYFLQPGPLKPFGVIEAIEKYKINLLQGTPAFWELILEAGFEKPKHFFRAITGGDKLSSKTARSLERTSDTAWNFYGPTEATIWSTYWKIKNKVRRVELGIPFDNIDLYVLDDEYKSTSTGSIGQLYIGGLALAKGYHNNHHLTEASFININLKGKGNKRLYRTGDLVRLLPGKKLEFIQRNDQQVKIRGHRIELEEIENLLLTDPNVTKAAVILLESGDNIQRLVAMVETKLDNSLCNQLYLLLSSSLPIYMLPSEIQIINNFPLTHNGKVDKKKLYEICKFQRQNLINDERIEASYESCVANAIKHILQKDHIHYERSFFHNGGNSLLAMKLIAYLRDNYQINLPLNLIYEAHSIESVINGYPKFDVTFININKHQIYFSSWKTLKISICKQLSNFINCFERAKTKNTFECGATTLLRLDHKATETIAFTVKLEAIVNTEEIKRAIISFIHSQQLLRATLFCSKKTYMFQEKKVEDLFIPFINLQLYSFQDQLAVCKNIINLISTSLEKSELINKPLYGIFLVKEDKATHRIVFALEHLISDNASASILVNFLSNYFYKKQMNIELTKQPFVSLTYEKHIANIKASLNQATVIDIKDSSYLKQATLATKLYYEYINSVNVSYNPSKKSFTIDYNYSSQNPKSTVPAILGDIISLFSRLLAFKTNLNLIPLRIITNYRQLGEHKTRSLLGDLTDSLPFISDTQELCPYKIQEQLHRLKSYLYNNYKTHFRSLSYYTTVCKEVDFNKLLKINYLGDYKKIYDAPFLSNINKRRSNEVVAYSIGGTRVRILYNHLLPLDIRIQDLHECIAFLPDIISIKTIEK